MFPKLHPILHILAKIGQVDGSPHSGEQEFQIADSGFNGLNER